jgi:hypothetical protein
MKTINKMTLKSLALIVGIYIFWLWATLFSYFQKNKSLHDFTLAVGNVENIEILNLPTRNNHDAQAIVISILNSPLKFGFQNKYKSFYEKLRNMEIVGKNIKIHYNSNGTFVENNLTLWVSQIEIEDKIFFPLNAYQEEMSIGLKIQLFFLCVFTLFMFYAIYLYKRDNSSAANPR